MNVLFFLTREEGMAEERKQKRKVRMKEERKERQEEGKKVRSKKERNRVK